jgi:3-isopropylmalate/(R)-2-methylmalate dehydratase large subunit
MKLTYLGSLPRGVFSKDLILYTIGQIGADGATYMSMEFYGKAVEEMSVDARFTISNMAIEAGGKAGIMEADKKVLEWVKKHAAKTSCCGKSNCCSAKKPNPVFADKGAKYAKEIEFDISKLSPQIAKPHAVDNVSSIEEVAGLPIQQGLIGTCTNGRFEDFEIAAKILKGKKVKDGCRLVLAPASKEIFLQLIKTGIATALINAGGVFVTPGCGPCVGTHNGVPSEGENVISTANRNFLGRMGNRKAFIYLGSPATVAASVIEGQIADPRKYL